MARISTRKSVDVDYWRGRLEAARAFHKAAEDAITLAEPGSNANPAISQMVLAAIADGDCLTARRANVINQQSHAAAPKLLRDVLGATLLLLCQIRIHLPVIYVCHVVECHMS